MRNKLCLLGLFSAMMLITSCTKIDEGAIYSTNAGWTVDKEMNKAGEYVVSVGESIVFEDISKDVKSHQWIIEEGCSFESGSGTESTSAKETITFNEEGFFKVTLYNTYSTDVSNPRESILAIKDGNVWVVEQEFWVNVYGELEPSLLVVQVMRTGETKQLMELERGFEAPSNSADWTQATITTGDRIVFIDEASKGADQWYVNYGGMSVAGSKGSVNVLFSEPATYSDFEYEVSRVEPEAQIVKTLPLVVEVIEYVEPDIKPEPVNMVPDAQMPVFDFEAAAGSYWSNNADCYLLSDAKAASGSKSLKVTGGVNSKDANYMPVAANAFDLPAGLYTFSLQVYVEDAALAGKAFGMSHHLASGWGYLTDESGANVTYTLPTETGKWVTIEKVLKITEGQLKDGQFKFRFDLLANTPAGVFYVDNIKLATYVGDDAGDSGDSTAECLFSEAQTSLYGFDNAYSSNYWTAGAMGSAYYSLVTDKVAAGTGALKFATATAIGANANVAFLLDANAANQFVVTEAGKYTLEYQVFVADNAVDTKDKNYIVDFKSGAAAPFAWITCNEDAMYALPTTKGEWVKVSKTLTLDPTVLTASKLTLRVSMPEGTPAGTEVYFDDFKLYKAN